MRIGVIIPDRGDRPEFLENCKRMIRAQTTHPAFTYIDSLPVKSDDFDIVPRIKRLYEKVNFIAHIDKVDVIAIWENDDWYAPDYLEIMAAAWDKHGRPDLFGTCYTVYYHIKLKRYFTMEHHQRASLMNTMIRPGLTFPWCVDNEPYLDLHLWHGSGMGPAPILNRKIFKPEKHISIGIKHGIGKCGGGSHNLDERIEGRYYNLDNGFLKATLDPESFEFYNNYFKA